MPSKIDIFNRAIQEVGGKPILSPDEDSPSTRACEQVWDMVREEVLQEHTWNRVTHREVLPPLEGAPAFGYGFAYALPEKCLRVVSVNDHDINTRRWVVEANGILTDEGPTANVQYIRDEDDTSKFVGLLGSALAFRLALAIIERRRGSTSKKQLLAELYDEVLSKAKAADVREQSSVEWEDARAIQARVI